MIGIDTPKVISSECPKYPAPDRFTAKPKLRMQILDTFQEDAKDVTTWLVKDALRAALSYVRWLKANTQAADNEKYGICASAKGEEIRYCDADLSMIIEAEKQIRNVMQLLTEDEPARTGASDHE